MLLFKKILCPIDFSEPSYKALKAANDLAKEFKSELILIHVLSTVNVFPESLGFAPGQPVSSTYLPKDIADALEKHAVESLKKTFNEKISEGINAKTEILRGNAAEEIGKYAEESNVSAIIMGTHGFTGWRHLLLGSVTEKVVRIASCPVLTIPAEKE